MTDDKGAQKLGRERRELWRRLNSSRVVSPFPAADLSQRMDEAVSKWWRDIFEYFGVDPASPNSWEQIARCLAGTLFPDFKILGTSNIGAPKTQQLVDELLVLFEAYDPPDKGSTYKQFLRDHQDVCRACNIKSDKSLKDAVYRARRTRERVKAQMEILLRFEAMKAFGISISSIISPAGG